jgi:hypothetical protein
VVGWLGGVQAQELGVAKRSIAQRSRGRVTSADLDLAVAEGRIDGGGASETAAFGEVGTATLTGGPA